jgi:hypothetical protein
VPEHRPPAGHVKLEIPGCSVIGRTRFTLLVGLVAGCQGAGRPAATTVATPGAPTCRTLGVADLETCTQPAPARSGGDLTITIRRIADQAVLWTEVADELAQASVVGDRRPPSLQVVIVHHVEPTDDEDAEDAYYVVDLELVDGKIVEVNRFRDSGD